MKRQIDIEHLLIWAYRDQCADRVAALQDAATGLGAPRARSATDVMMAIAELGTRVSSSPRHVVELGARADADALAVHDAVLDLPAHVAALVIINGRGAARPYYHGMDAEWPVPMRDEQGRVVHVRDPVSKRRVACRLRLPVSPDLVAHSRDAYGTWWGALEGLAAALEKELRSYNPLPPKALRAPWMVRPLLYLDDYA